jgi:hypothetical protein
MNAKALFFNVDNAGFLLGLAVLATLSGCVGYVDGPRVGVYAEPTVFAAQDDYLYYPGYDVYYSSQRHQYAYLSGGAWVSRPAPRGVSVDVLLKSPSVKMDFHDSPAIHHAAVVQKYPKNWAPAGSNQKQKESHNADKHDERGNNHGN